MRNREKHSPNERNEIARSDKKYHHHLIEEMKNEQKKVRKLHKK